MLYRQSRLFARAESFICILHLDCIRGAARRGRSSLPAIGVMANRARYFAINGTNGGGGSEEGEGEEKMLVFFCAGFVWPRQVSSQRFIDKYRDYVAGVSIAL